MRTRYLLHGGQLKVENQDNERFFGALQREVPAGGSIVFVFFARPDLDPQEILARWRDRLHRTSGGKNVKYLVADQESLATQLATADAVYLHGGDTPTLLRALQRCPDFSRLIQGKTVGGSSAGAYVLATWFFDNDHQQLMSGLGCLPLKVHAHHAGQPNALAALATVGHDLDLVLLPEFATKELVVNE